MSNWFASSYVCVSPERQQCAQSPSLFWGRLFTSIMEYFRWNAPWYLCCQHTQYQLNMDHRCRDGYAEWFLVRRTREDQNCVSKTAAVCPCLTIVQFTSCTCEQCSQLQICWVHILKGSSTQWGKVVQLNSKQFFDLDIKTHTLPKPNPVFSHLNGQLAQNSKATIWSLSSYLLGNVHLGVVTSTQLLWTAFGPSTSLLFFIDTNFAVCYVPVQVYLVKGLATKIGKCWLSWLWEGERDRDRDSWHGTWHTHCKLENPPKTAS